MLVQWNKDADAALAEAKSKKKPVLIDFSAAPLEVHALGWRLSHTAIKIRQHSSMTISFLSKHTSKNIRLTFIGSTQSGHHQF